MDLEHLRLGESKSPHHRPRVWLGHTLDLCIAAVITLPLWGCGTAPFVDGRREAGQTTPVGPSTPDRVAICYSNRGTTPKDVLKLAQSECAKTNRAAQFDGQDPFRCALLAPTRAFFKCVGK